MDLSATGRINEGSGSGRGGDVRHTPPEHRRPVYRHSADTGDISGRRATSRGAGVNDMVVSGRAQPGSGVDGEGYVDRGGGIRVGQNPEGGGVGEEGIGRAGENQYGNWDIKDM